MTSSAVDEVQMQVDTNNQEFESRDGHQSDTAVETGQASSSSSSSSASSATAVEESICRTSAFLSPFDNSTSVKQSCCVAEVLVPSSESGNDDDEGNDDAENLFYPDEALEEVRKQRMEKRQLMKEHLIRTRDRLIKNVNDWAEERRKIITENYRRQFPAWWLEVKEQLKDGRWDGKTPLPWITDSHINELKEILNRMTGVDCEDVSDSETEDEDEGESAQRSGYSEHRELGQSKRRKTEADQNKENWGESQQMATETGQEKITAIGDEQQHNGGAAEPHEEFDSDNNRIRGGHDISTDQIDVDGDDLDEDSDEDWKNRPFSPLLPARSSVTDIATITAGSRKNKQ